MRAVAQPQVSACTGNQDQSAKPKFFTSGMTLAIVGTFLFALKSILIKLAFAEGATAQTFLTIRMLLAFPFYALVLWQSQRARHQSRENTDLRPKKYDLAKAFCLGFLGYYLASLLDMFALELISAQLERLTLFTYPTMIAVLAWLFLGEAMTVRIVASLALCYGGIFVMFSQEQSLMSGANVRLGVFLAIASATSYSLYVVIAKPIMQRIGSRQFTSLAMIGSTFFVLVHFFSMHSLGSLALPAQVWFYGIMVAFVCTVLPSFLVNEAIVRIGATKTTVTGTIGPVVTTLMAIIILGEPTTPLHFLGMAIVIAGVLMVARK